MAAGQARSEWLRTGKRVRITDRYGKPRWHELWNGLEWLARPWETGNFAAVLNDKGHRPYLKSWNGRRQQYSDWRARDHIGGFSFTGSERAFAWKVAQKHPGFVLIEPNVKRLAKANKQWGFHRWQKLVDLCSDIDWVQIGETGSQVLRGVTFVETPTFRQAAAIIAQARLSVVPEGALHHAAAHLGRKAVVLVGGSIPEHALCYPGHDNIVDHGPGSPCGSWYRCQHCERIWASITPQMVKDRLERCLMETIVHVERFERASV